LEKKYLQSQKDPKYGNPIKRTRWTTLSLNFDAIDWMSTEAETLARYWKQLQTSEAVPRRVDFDPAEVSTILPGIMILEVISDENIIVRLTGTALTELFGQEITGMDFLDFWPPGLRYEAGKVLMSLVSKPCGLLVRIVGTTEQNVEVSSVSVGFPLIGRNDKCDMLVFHTDDAILPVTHNSRTDNLTSLRVKRRLVIDIENW
jgi:hypothetical protein